MPGMPGMGGSGDDIAKQAGTWLILGIVSALCCCLPAGIVGAVFANQAKTFAAQGDMANAQQKLKTAKMVTIIGAAIGVVLIIASVIFQVVMGGLANAF